MLSLFGVSQKSAGRQRLRGVSACAALLALAAATVLAVPMVFAEAPANDTCDNATVLTTPAHITEDGSTATSDFVTVVDDSGTYEGIEFTHAVWFSFTSPGPGYLLYSDANYSQENSELHAFGLFPSCGGAGISCRGFDPLVSEANEYPLSAAGQTLELMVSDGAPDLGLPPSVDQNYDLSFSFVASTVPTNDNCNTATDLTNAVPFNGIVDNMLATDDVTTACGTIYRGVWYSLTAPSAGYLTCTCTQFGQGTYKSSQPALWATQSGCGGAITCLGDDSQPRYIVVNAGDTVKLLVGSSLPTLHSDFQTLVRLRPNITFTPNLPNDNCMGAFDLNSVTLPYSTSQNVFATISDEDTDCFSVFHAAWYKYTPSVSGYLDVAVPGGNYLPASAVAYTADCMTTATCQPPAASNQNPTTYKVPISAGHAVNVLVGIGLSTVDAPTILQPTFSVEAVTPLCRADFDGNSTINVSDIFAFLRAWFAHSASADIDGNSTVNVSDIFAFLRHWFAHC